jgi:hypothetical protein
LCCCLAIEWSFHAMDEHENLTFRARPRWQSGRPARRSSAVLWIVIAVIAAILLLFFVPALLERTAWTAGDSPLPETVQATKTAPQGQDSADASALPQRYTPSVYRCVDRAGAVSLQSQPCGLDQRTTRVVAAPPEAALTPLRQASRPVTSNQNSYNTFQIQQADSHAMRVAACMSARQSREATLERVGLRRTYDLLQQLDEIVNSACKGL